MGTEGHGTWPTAIEKLPVLMTLKHLHNNNINKTEDRISPAVIFSRKFLLSICEAREESSNPARRVHVHRNLENIEDSCLVGVQFANSVTCEFH